MPPSSRPTWREVPPEFNVMFGGGIDMAPHPSLTLLDVLTTAKLSFESRLKYLGGVLCGGIRYQFNYSRCQRSIRDPRKYYM